MIDWGRLSRYMLGTPQIAPLGKFCRPQDGYQGAIEYLGQDFVTWGFEWPDVVTYL
jgi:hypothetical protein